MPKGKDSAAVKRKRDELKPSSSSSSSSDSDDGRVSSGAESKIEVASNKPGCNDMYPNGFPDDQSRQQWALNMRKKFTPKEMLNEDGTINHSFFKPKTTHIKVKKWTDRERALLLKGIETHGIGNWSTIRQELLPEWEENDLRIKTTRLIGRQNLQRYKGWTGTEEDIKAEYKKNFEIGLQYNAWKGGVLVADDEGNVEKALQELDSKRS